MNKKEILYIEDDDTLAFIISKKIEFLGHKVVICKNGSEAIEILSKNENFNLIVSDNILPCITGIELLKHIRENLKLKTPFVLLTLDNSIYLEKIFYKNKGTFFIKKPFKFETLIQIINHQ